MPILLGMVPFLFFCSGVTALIYELVWSKYLSLMFGSTTQAQTVVLAVFMGGLALGNRLFGWRGDRARRPLRMYGYLELAIGLYAFSFVWLYQATDAVFVKLGASLLAHSGWLLLLKGLLSVGLLLGPTVLMGGTLPVLSAWLATQYPDANRRTARFYSINSLGAVTGAALAGFFLVRLMGMVATLQMTGLFNVMIAFAAIAIARTQAESGSGKDLTSDVEISGPVHTPAASLTEAPRGQGNWLLWFGGMLVATTGAVSMGLEVLATRALAMIFGGSLQAFACVLMGFILGIGAGGAVMASPRVRRWPREATTFALLVLAAGLIGLYVQGIEKWVQVYSSLQFGLGRNEVGYRYHLIFNTLMAVVLLGLPAGLMGAVLPLWMREGGDGSKGLGSRIGCLLTWNTLGAVVGVLLTGFYLMPAVGLRKSFDILAILLGLVGLGLAWVRLSRAWACVSACLAVLLAASCLSGGKGWQYVLSSGVFRARDFVVDRKAMELRKQYVKILFYEDAADATVSVEQVVNGGSGAGELKLRINGKPDATSRGDLSTQYLVAHLPMLARPKSTDVFVLGFGSGITAGALLAYPIQRLDIAENCAAVLRAAPLFGPWNRRVDTNRVTRIWREDARTVLKLSPQPYDVIISEPSNPWTAGVGSVFSTEYFELAGRRLKPGGIMAQWFHIYEMSDEIVALVLRTFASVFPYVEIWDTGPGDIILLGSKQPWKNLVGSSLPEIPYEQSRLDLAAVGLANRAALWSRQLASQRTAFAIAGEGPVQSDAFPILEYEAPKAFFIGRNSRWLADFDERTWELELASRDKCRTLASLSDDSLKAIFGEYPSINPELNQFLSLRLRPSAQRDAADVYSGKRLLPCAFRVGALATNQWQRPATEGEPALQLWQAETALQAGPDRPGEALDRIAAILGTYRPDPTQAAAWWSPAFYAAMAIRAGLNSSDWMRAQTLLALGRKHEPADVQLAYLARILAREQALQPLAEPAVNQTANSSSAP